MGDEKRIGGEKEQIERGRKRKGTEMGRGKGKGYKGEREERESGCCLEGMEVRIV